MRMNHCVGNNVAYLQALERLVDASQEMIALGICNVAASFISSLPITGSFR